LAEKILPASELSEQISTAGTEASGTGNMKFMMNGALTVGTYDGANIEIAEEAGRENMFIFGLDVAQVEELRMKGYNPRDYINRSPVLAEVINRIQNNFFSSLEQGIFEPILQTIFGGDNYLICADFDDYCRAQSEVSRLYKDQEAWAQKAIHNVAKSGRFSSDRTVSEYSRQIWKVPF